MHVTFPPLSGSNAYDGNKERGQLAHVAWDSIATTVPDGQSTQVVAPDAAA